MNKLQRLRKIEEFKNTLSVPYPNTKEGIEFYYPTPYGGRFVYNLIYCKECINVVGELEQAIFLKKHNLISTYTVNRDGSVRMYKMSMLACEADQIIHWKDPQMVKWTDFEFTREQVAHFAAVNELEKMEARNAPGIIRKLFKAA